MKKKVQINIGGILLEVTAEYTEGEKGDGYLDPPSNSSVEIDKITFADKSGDDLHSLILELEGVPCSKRPDIIGWIEEKTINAIEEAEDFR